jgi:hypothetical protein
VTDRAAVAQWVDGYERARRTRGTDGLRALFTDDATDGRCATFEKWPFSPEKHATPTGGTA